MARTSDGATLGYDGLSQKDAGKGREQGSISSFQSQGQSGWVDQKVDHWADVGRPT